MPVIAPLRPGDPPRLGEYPLIGRLGEGGQGVVYLGLGPDDEQVAIKLLRTRLDGEGKVHARFAREVSIAERVAPFCTARVISADLLGEAPYIVSEYVDGPSLMDAVRDNGPMTGADLDRLAISTATALAAIHEAGIVHRDFKPGNVLLAADGPRVIDFGIARMLDATSTLTSRVIGTPSFMSPEQIGDEEIGPPSDMFAWGSTVVYAATGTSPFGGETIPAVLNRIVNHEPNLDALAEPLRSVVAAALSKDPAQRPTPRQVLDRMVGRGGGSAAPSVPPTVGLLPAPGTVRLPAPAPSNLIGPALGGLAGLYLLTLAAGPRWTSTVRMDLHLTTPQLVGVFAAYLVAALATAPAGVILGRRSPKAVAATAVVLMLLGALLDALTPSYGVLLTGRILSGLGAGALVADAVVIGLRERSQRAYLIGLGALAVVLGPVLGGVVTTAITWRWTFLLSLALLIPALPASLKRRV